MTLKISLRSNRFAILQIFSLHFIHAESNPSGTRAGRTKCVWPFGMEERTVLVSSDILLQPSFGGIGGKACKNVFRLNMLEWFWMQLRPKSRNSQRKKRCEKSAFDLLALRQQQSQSVQTSYCKHPSQAEGAKLARMCFVCICLKVTQKAIEAEKEKLQIQNDLFKVSEVCSWFCGI